MPQETMGQFFEGLARAENPPGSLLFDRPGGHHALEFSGSLLALVGGALGVHLATAGHVHGHAVVDGSRWRSCGMALLHERALHILNSAGFDDGLLPAQIGGVDTQDDHRPPEDCK